MADEAAQTQRDAYQQDIRIGEECAKFVESEVVQGWFARIESQILDEALKLHADFTNPNLGVAHTRAMLAIDMVRRLRTYMRKCVETGEASAAMLAQMLKAEAHG